MIQKMQKEKGFTRPKYNKSACTYFDTLNDLIGLNGLHAENGGERYLKELGYWVDYYSPELNMIIEWDEAGHFDKGELKEKDVARQEEITNHLGCKFLRINQTKDLNPQLNLVVAYAEILKERAASSV